MNAKLELKKEELDSLVYDFSDEILPVGDVGFSDTLNFYVVAYDKLYVWAGLFSSIEELHSKLDTENGVCTTYADYNPRKKTITLSIEDMNYEYHDFDLFGSGVEVLADYLEEYCKKHEQKTCIEVLDEYNKE